ncbi:MAG TPA: PEP/pyruvate-binding domain-containing protein [Candidatus Krumholzibacteria bacterium]|nr:PEP/pyruvate-binding domain-containing protein [Candidatus Krumholzibacteria bacterium]HPD71042.1 PEP/pyruvate-binding domain-containing protein [Candidatus Krumholzibacteria bacterium]HRY39258.1 PEP/pyruvate-binding domain-containing protein [Candidatus Krumholzibacteria bacterium]
MSDAFWSRLRTGGEERFSGFGHLMPYRIQEVLLVASMYDAFTLEEGGRLTELLLNEYRELNLSFAPRITKATSASEALELLETRRFDLVLTMSRLGDLPAGEFSCRVKDRRPDLPVYALVLNPRELQVMQSPDRASRVDRVFLWNGDVRVLLAGIKNWEDQRNLDHDTRYGDVRVILVIEDSVRFYSAYLPLLYTEIMRQTQNLMDEGINLSHRLLRMRARPKILLATTFEEAWSWYERYAESLLGVIADGRFPWHGELADRAGLAFIGQAKAADPHLPAVLQSTDPTLRAEAAAAGAGFIDKNSPQLLQDLRHFLAENCGFGDFVFRLADGRELGRARDLRELVKLLHEVPAESILHHASHDHFSTWMRARTEFALADMLRPHKTHEFASAEDLRAWLVRSLERFRTESQRGIVADFSRETFDASTAFTRIGGGSLGGKARGLAFMNTLFSRAHVADRFPGVEIEVPPTAVLGTDVYDAYLDRNRLRERLLGGGLADQEVVRLFLDNGLPDGVMADLRAFLAQVRCPIAVRSSSLLEDSQFQPFAGVYATYMLPNSHADLAVRLAQLGDAVKLVYASVFQAGARAYLEASGSRVEEEKMAVILQEVVGRRHEHYVYPDFAGVAYSTDFYPAPGTPSTDGVVCAALGLGRLVVEGGNVLRFNPRRPGKLPQFGTIEAWLKGSQRIFQAVDVSRADACPEASETYNVASLDLEVAERHGTLAAVGSTYSVENRAIYDGISRPGPRLVTFAHVLKSNLFPLADILSFLLELGQDCLSAPVEIEWAVTLSPAPQRPHRFGLLQIRPLAVAGAGVSLAPADLEGARTLVSCEIALGNGRYENLRDIVYVPPARFDRGATVAIAAEIAEINGRLKRAQRPYVLVGSGRWGSADRWLGIPVRWEQISGAQVIVETDLPDFLVTPSEGTHFFQNLTSFQVGYLTVNHGRAHTVCRWDRLDQTAAAWEGTYVRHLQFAAPLDVRIDGRSRRGLIRLAPAESPNLTTRSQERK